MADFDTTWAWNFSGPTTMSKAQSRPFTPREIAWDLTGFDGNTTGSLRTHPGFKKVHTFSFDKTHTLQDVFPVTLTYDSSTFYVGHVVVRTGGGSTFFDLYLSSDGTTYTHVGGTHFHTVAATGLEVDVQSYGRFIYVLLRGQTVRVAWLSNNSPLTLTVEAAGPGVPPRVETQNDASGTSPTGLGTISNVGGVASVTITAGGSGYTDTAPPTVTFAAPSNPGRTATGYAKCSGGVVTEIVVTDQGSGYSSAPAITFSSGAATATAVLDPNATNGQSTRGRLAVMVDESAVAGKTLFKSGRYGFAVQFLDSTTGRKTQISETVQLTVPQTTGNTDQNLPIVVRVWFPSTYTGGAWVRGSFDKALIYRTVNQGTGGSLYGSGALHLDHIITAPASTAVVVPASSNLRVPDTQLVYQDTFAGRTRADDVVPQGGVGQFLGSTLFVSRILGDTASQLTDNTTGVTPFLPKPGVGDLRWSTTLDVQPENFSPFNRWVPTTVGNEIIAMRRVGPYMIGCSPDRMYRIGRAGAFIKVEEMHVGYGCSGRQTIESVGTMAYVICGSGLKAVSAEGQLEDVTSLDNLLNGEWLSGKSNLQMAFDAVGQCLTILKPCSAGGDGEAACLWFGTNRITMLQDLPFRHVRSGNWIVGGQTQRRAFFTKRTTTGNSGSVTTASFSIYVVDHERSRSTGRNLVDNTTTYASSSGAFTVNLVNNDLLDCAYYNIVTMAKAVVTVTGNSGVPLNEDVFTVTVNAAEPLSFAPMTLRWTGGNLGFQPQQGMPEFKDFFKMKQITTGSAYLEIVSNAASVPTGMAWRSQVYRGAETAVLATATPVDRDGATVSTFSTTSPPVGDDMPAAPFGRHGVVGAALSPSFFCFASGLDMRLLAFSASGRILDSERRRI